MSESPSESCPESLEIAPEDIVNPNIVETLEYLTSSGRRCVAVEHPEETMTCDEKAALFARYEIAYAKYRPLRIARGSVLLWKMHHGSAKYLLYLSDSEDRINWKELRWQLNLAKKDDVRFFDGDVEDIVGLPRGGVSPFVCENHRLSKILFDRRLLSRQLSAPDALWDFAFSRKHSLLAQPGMVFDALACHPLLRPVLHWTAIHPMLH